MLTIIARMLTRRDTVVPPVTTSPTVVQLRAEVWFETRANYLMTGGI